MENTGLFHRPGNRWAGDCVPFLHGDVYHVFYLCTHDERQRSPVVWAHRSSSDLIRWTEYPLAITAGARGAPDENGCGTGSVYEHGGIFHLFYTGVTNPDHWDGRAGEQVICHAQSNDLVVWKKDEGSPVSVPDSAHYEVHHWRDPFIFWNEETEEHVMLITARERGTFWARAGCLVWATSRDPLLRSWELRGTYYRPLFEYCLECSELYPLKGQWILTNHLWSAYRNRSRTAYRVSDSPFGLWKAAPRETLDGTRYLAAKSCPSLDGDRRLYFGWIPRNEPHDDDSGWDWGGNLAVPYEVDLDSGGALAVRCPDVFRQLGRLVDPAPGPDPIGSWRRTENLIEGGRLDGAAFYFLSGLPGNFQLELTLQWTEPVRAAGILFHVDSSLQHGAMLKFDIQQSEVSIDRLISAASGTRSVRCPDIVRLPFIMPASQSIPVRLFVEESCVQAFIGEQSALTCRVYDRRGAGSVALFVQDGSAQFHDMLVRDVSRKEDLIT